VNDLFHGVLFIHVLNGTVALLIAPLAMITVKGGLWHRRWGQIYFWAMFGVAVTAVVMCFLRSGLFLFLVAIFSFYMALTGYTVLKRKRPEDRPGLLDWCAAAAMLLAGAFLVVSGAMSANLGGQGSVRIVFGTLGLLLAGSDIRSFFKPSMNKRAWWFAHMSRFLGAYIATVTAFSVVNFEFLPYLARWLWPTVIGVTGIFVWRAYYKKQFARAPSAS
jgi:uncharacterized membrane protein